VVLVPVCVDVQELVIVVEPVWLGVLVPLEVIGLVGVCVKELVTEGVCDAVCVCVLELVIVFVDVWVTVALLVPV